MLSASRVDLGPLFFVLAGSAMAAARQQHTQRTLFTRTAHALTPL